MKKVIMGLFLSLLVSSVFATNWLKYGTYETEEMGTIDVYFDLDSTEPRDIKNESIRYFLFLQDIYEDVDVWLEKTEDWWLYSEAIEYNCYAICIESESFYTNIYIHDDNTVTVYTYREAEEEAEAEE